MSLITSTEHFFFKFSVLALRFFIRAFFYRSRLVRRQIERTSLEIPSREAGRTILVEIYLPTEKRASPLPVLLNWHGSAFFLPGHGSDAFFCKYIAETVGVAVVDADYRKGPEDPFPAAVHDAEDVLRWVFNNTEDFDSSRVLLSGFSAGGNLALVLAASLGEDISQRNRDSVRGVVAFYPPTDLSIAPGARSAPNPKYRNPIALHKLSYKCYIPSSVDPSDPYLSPSFADEKNFPSNVIIITCDGDCLCTEAEDLADKLDDGTRRVISRRLTNVGHGYDKNCQEGSREERLRDDVYLSVAKCMKGILNP